MLNSKQTDAFFAVTQTGSFDLAATTLNITASAVTLRVQNLEKSLGHLLLVRDRPCRVTKAGQTLLNYLQHQKRLQQSLMQDLGGQDVGNGFYQLNIASNADSLASWLLPTIQSTLLKHQMTLHVQVDDQSRTHHLLEAGRVSACLSTQANPMKGCVAEQLGKMHYHLLATPEFMNRWFSTGCHRDNLRLAPAIMFNEQDRLHSDFILQNFGLNPTQYPHHLIPSYNAFYDAILSGLGFGWVPAFQARKAMLQGSLVELIKDTPLELSLYWHHWKQQSPQLELLTKVLCREATHAMNVENYAHSK